jgi:biopolymer transport protein ExbD
MSVAGMEEPNGSSEIMSQINVTPLVDVLLVLLLVLMVSASAAVARALDVHLPSAGSGETQSSTLTLRIDREGQCWLDDERIDAPRLGERLSALGAPEQLSVVIAADGATAHRYVIDVLDVLRAQRVTDVAFAVRALERSP